MRLDSSVAIFLLLAGCGGLTQPAKAPAPPSPVASAPAPTAPFVPAAPPKASASVPAKAPPASPTAAPAKAPAKPAPPATTALATPSPAEARPVTPPTLDLKSLEDRLKDSNAIGVLTKLSLKNQVDDLIAQFRAFHSGQRPPMTLAELRRPFELLLMKVLSLLQDKDTALARDINASKDAIWGVLSDRSKLAQFV